MSGDSIVERVAIALHGSGILAPPPDHSWTECVVKDEFRRAARAVIEAMRDVECLPMLVAGKNALFSCSEDPTLEDARNCFHAILAVALTEKS